MNDKVHAEWRYKGSIDRKGNEEQAPLLEEKDVNHRVDRKFSTQKDHMAEGSNVSIAEFVSVSFLITSISFPIFTAS